MTIDDMIRIAEEHKGICHSRKYINAQTHLSWECQLGHKFRKPYRDVYMGQWCPHCSKRPPVNIWDVKALAKKMKGKCLTNKYVNARTKLHWVCEVGHHWDSTYDNVKNKGSWCPTCVGVSKKTINQMNETAELRGGRCLSEEYRNGSSPLKWRCKFGHVWSASWQSIGVNGSWCPTCSSGLGERLCREAIEHLTRQPFAKSYPKWLKSSQGTQLELDGYNAKLSIAFEHQGVQHYRNVKYFHKTKQAFRALRKRDSEKRNLCKSIGVLLIEIPPVPEKMNIFELEKFLRNKLETAGLKINSKKVEYRKAYETNFAIDRFEELKIWAKKNGGKLLSKKYINEKTPLSWVCKNGHSWTVAPNSRTRWCFKCAKLELELENKQKWLVNVNKILHKYKFKCVGSITRASERHRWVCRKCNHKWHDSWNGITTRAKKPFNHKYDQMCPNCRNIKRKAQDSKRK